MSAPNSPATLRTYEAVKVDDIELGNVKEQKNPSTVDNYMDEHMLPIPQMLEVLGTNMETGLSSEEAEIRLKRDGYNRLTPPPKPFWLTILISHVAGSFSILLWIGSILCFIVYSLDDSIENLTLGIILAAVVTLTGIFSYYQELRSDAVLEGFMKLSPSTCDVLRDGKFETIAAENLVKGDIIRLQFGKKVPADVIVLENTGIKVDNSSLTGEAEPVKRSVEASDPSPWRSKNVAFFGTNCVEGTAKCVVARCGDHTAIGGLASLTAREPAPEPLMKQEIEHFVKLIAAIAVIIGIVFLICALVMGYEPQGTLTHSLTYYALTDSLTQASVIFMIGIIVANVPEGLLATVTVALTITALRMAESNVLVKSNLIVETLGSVNVIASDKTGTLTQNRMTVRNVIFADGYTAVATHVKHRTSLDVLADSDSPANALMKATYREYYDKLINLAGLCNHASFDEREHEILKRRTNGDASENALLKFCHSNSNQDALRVKFPEVACVPFNSTNKIMITIHQVPSSSEYLVIMKGAPERVFERCTHYIDPENGKRKPLDRPSRQRIVDSNMNLASNGERVLAFAEIRLRGLSSDYKFETENLNEINFDLTELNFAGMISLEDPPRAEVPAAIKCCHEAGIKVIMVTGDHPLTARSIAAQIGILTENNGGKLTKIFDLQEAFEIRRDESISGVVVTGNDLPLLRYSLTHLTTYSLTHLPSLSAEDWDYILSRSGIVFARTLPAQKQEIVKNLQSKDYVVAVTGDGVNDSPALKKADVGVAMGSGSEIAKEAADLILIDDNFASIVKGIEEGRLIFSNLKKSIAYTLTSNIPEIVPFLAQIALQIPLGLTTILILVVDLGTDILPAISYAYETAESDIMKIPPRNRHRDKLVTWQLVSFSYLQVGVIQAFAAFTAFFHVLNQNGFSTSYLMQAKVGVIWIDPDENTCFENSLTNNPGVINGCATYDFRMGVLKEAQSAFLTAIVICQMGAGIACKTRVSSIFTHGIWNNRVFLWGLCQEVGLICMVVYIAGLNHGFETLPIRGDAWGIVFPFAAFLFCYDEIRKFICRKFPGSKFKEYFFY